MSENLNGIQIQLLLYFLEAEPKKRTVTDAARYLNKPKSTLTHILDSLDELALMERVEGRKSVLTAAGKEPRRSCCTSGKFWSSICSTRTSRPHR